MNLKSKSNVFKSKNKQELKAEINSLTPKEFFDAYGKKDYIKHLPMGPRKRIYYWFKRMETVMLISFVILLTVMIISTFTSLFVNNSFIDNLALVTTIIWLGLAGIVTLTLYDYEKY